MVKYGKKSADKNLILKVSENNLEFVGLGYAIRPKAGGLKLTTILLVLVIILLIANLSWFVFFRRFLRRRKEARAGKGKFKF